HRGHGFSDRLDVIDEELARDPEHRSGLELLDHLEGDVSVVVPQQQGAESHHEIEDLVAIDVVDVAAVAIVSEERMGFEVPDIALDSAGGDSSGPAPELRALLVSHPVLPAELLGRQGITSKGKQGRRRAPTHAVAVDGRRELPVTWARLRCLWKHEQLSRTVCDLYIKRERL